MVTERIGVGVTGIGLVSPLGNTVESSWDRMVKGEHGFSRLDPPFRYKGADRVFVVARVNDFSQHVLSPKEAERAHLSALYAVEATSEALTQAGLWRDGVLQGISPNEIGVKIGTGFGGACDITEVAKALEEGSSLKRKYALIVEPERVATVASMAFGLKNSATTTIAACATGGINIGEAYHRITSGRATAMVAGSAEAVIRPETLAIYNQVGALSARDDPAFASTPFDQARSGFVAAEGAGIMVLENLVHAEKRGAKVLAELVSATDTSDAGDATSPSGEGQQRAMNQALEQAELKPAEISYVNAHGTGTLLGDRVELESIEQVFGKHADNLPVSSLKWQLGHMVGASASAEAVLAIKMIQEGIVIPNTGLRNPLRDDMNLLTQPWYHSIDTVMKTSFGFGGINVVLILRKPIR